MLTRNGPKGHALDQHAQLGGAQVLAGSDLRQVRSRHPKSLGKPLAGPALAGLDKGFKFHACSLVSAKPLCQAFASLAITKHTGRVNITNTRRERLKAWFANRTLPEKEKSYLSQLIGGKASFGEKAARRLESTYGMPVKYLDTPLDEAVEPIHNAPSDIAEDWELLTSEQRASFTAQIKEKADYNRAILAQLAPPGVQQRTVSVSDRRMRQTGNPTFADRRKKHGQG